MSSRTSSPTLLLPAAMETLYASRSALLDMLLAAERLRIEAELHQRGLPDISETLAALAKMQRFDACKLLIGAYEDFVEAQVNLQLAIHRNEYAKIVEAPTDPEYLREDKSR